MEFFWETLIIKNHLDYSNQITFYSCKKCQNIVFSSNKIDHHVRFIKKDNSEIELTQSEPTEVFFAAPEKSFKNLVVKVTEELLIDLSKDS